jgi:hypothetical protein
MDRAMTIRDALNAYLRDIEQELKHAEAREHAYRPALKTLLEALAPGFHAINEPAHIQAGAPDFIVMRGQTPVGFVEAKDIDERLSRIENGEQMKRYRDALPNLILTDYIEFRWYVGGEPRGTARLGEVRDGKIRRDDEGIDEVGRRLAAFALEQTPTIRTARELATRMAGMTREIRGLIENSLPDSSQLQGEMAAFKKTLIPNLTAAQFADMYAQTMAYGLFAARVRWVDDPANFSLHKAFWGLPETNPFLRDVFQQIAPHLDKRVAWLVDSLADLLAHADTGEILRDFGRATRQEDPVVHFYETFLTAYDPALRERRGVYYTPEPVVSYIVRSVDHLLRARFRRPDGLADGNTMILDPATGTGTFLYFVIQRIHETLEQRGQLGAWDRYARDHLLPRLFGFELLVAPYAVAHMKLGIQLHDLGYTFQSGQRLGIYLTNTLEQEIREGAKPLGFEGFIAEEANEAQAVKRAKPIMVVLGNPPYSGHSANRSRDAEGKLNWIGRLLRDYYFVDGQPLGERNPKWLQDDYVKFIRFGQWRIAQTGEGVLAFVTNHGYLDNPTFRGMRQQLMSAFSDIYILNLHGNSRKKETAPDGSLDENVFDIQQGVAIGIFVTPPSGSLPASREGEGARVHYRDVWGLREDKYEWLLEHELADTAWTEIEPSAPYYLFLPQDNDLKAEYERGWIITDILPINGWGIATRKDYLLVDFSRDDLVRKFRDMRSLPTSDAMRKYGVKQSPHWDFATAQRQIPENVQDRIEAILFRPFDVRFVFYETYMIERGDHRYSLMRHMLDENISLITVRRSETTGIPQHFYCTDEMSVLHSTSSKEGNFVFPLYLYPDPNEMLSDSPWKLSDQGRRPNLNPQFVADLEERLGMAFVSEGCGDLEATFGPEDVLAYAYAIFHSPTYRARYAEFLKIDFPRLPLTADPGLFAALVALGRALVDLHLLRGPALSHLITTFPVEGDARVERGYPKYTLPAPPSLLAGREPEGGVLGRVYINKTQYFEGIPPDVWEFYVGGYQVLEKWLKDRRERVLSWDDIQHYQRIVVALAETIRLMAEIDATIPAWPLA